MQDFNSYIKTKLKSKNMKLNTFINKTEMSKSTIYRVMKGLQKPSDELIDKFAEILNLNPIEKREMIYYINLNDSAEDATSTRKAIFDLLYSDEDHELGRIELVFYDKGQKFIKYFDDILNEIYSKSDNFDFECNLKIINCYDENIIRPVVDMASKFETEKQKYSIEHLVKISSTNSTNSIEILGEVIPFLKLKNYVLSYSDTISYGDSLIENFMHIEVKYDKEGEEAVDNYYFSFMNDYLSACYLTDNNNNFNDFFIRNYSYLSQHYKQAISNLKSYDVFGDVLFRLEKENVSYLFKGNPCYNRIPISVYKSMINRLSEEDMNRIIASTSTSASSSIVSSSDKILDIVRYIETRSDISKEHRQVDIFTTSGMIEFVNSGRLSDHINGLPPFSKSEIKGIIENIIRKYEDKNDMYDLYVVDDNGYSKKDFIITAYENSSVLIEYICNNGNQSNTNYFLIENKELSKSFTEFADNYISGIVAMTKKDAISFLKNLIK